MGFATKYYHSPRALLTQISSIILYKKLNISNTQIKHHEKLLIEAYLYNLLYRKARCKFRNQFEDQIKFLNTHLSEDEVMDNNLSYYLVQDLLATGNFTLEGIAYETKTHVDVIIDIASGIRTNISAAIFNRIIKLHINTKRSVYSELIKRLLIIIENK